MLGGSMFDEDPFFAGHRQHMQQMQQMQQLMMPSMMHPHALVQQQAAQPDPVQAAHRPHSNHRHRHRHRPREVVPFGMFGPMDFGSMFNNMHRMMDDMRRSFGQVQMASPGPNTHTFSQSSFVSFSNNGQGQPQVYQATSSTRQAPGGVKETRRTVRDTSSGMEKMAIGHHISDRAHIIERSRNRHTGDQDENQEYVNIDEEEAPEFDREWQEKTRHPPRGMDLHRARHNPIGNVRTGRQLALPEPRVRNRSHRDRE